jgi:FtsX-like permease family
MPQQQATDLLTHDPDIAQWSPAYLGTLRLDGQPTPVIGEDPGAAVGPAILTGRAVEAPDEVIVGPITLATLHKALGDTVVVAASGPSPTTLRIVGTAAFPAVSTGNSHMEMGTGAGVPTAVIPPVDRNPFNDPQPGPNIALVRLRSGVNRPPALQRLQQIATATSNTANFGVAVTPVLRPAEIVNYRSMGTTPAALGGGLAVGAAFALGLTLIASVRRRRRDLALLKALGFTRRQLAAAVAWQSTVAVTIGTVVGTPLGIALGRLLWDAFARKIHVVPSPTVPAASVAVVVVGGLLLANLVAALPGRQAARTPVALVLRAE